MPESKQSSNVNASGALWVLLAAAGTYFVVHTPPLEGSRPPTTEAGLHEQASLQDAESRMWQDPFAVVADKLAKSNDLKLENCTEKLEIIVHCRSPLSPEPPAPIVLVASVSGAAYSEDHEYRRRLRYAIVAGLARKGFAPRDAQHLGFFWPRAVIEPRARLPDVVPFEWFDSRNKKSSALLLWFDEDVIEGSAPLRTFDEFLCRILPTGKRASVTLGKPRVLGPELSTTLKAMADESKDDLSSGLCQDDKREEFYVFSATASDTALIPRAEYEKLRDKGCRKAGDCLSRFFFEKFDKKVKLYRTTVTDVGLAQAMRDELALRWPHRIFDGVDRPLLDGVTRWVPAPERLTKALGFVDESDQHHIVLISEWDTLYGQSLPKAITSCMALALETECDEIKERLLYKTFVHRYSYLRGLDGQLPNGGATNSGKAAEGGGKNQVANDTQDKGSKDRTKTASGAKPNDRAEGQGQFDYLRRLGDQIVSLDDRLRSGLEEEVSRRSRNGIAAVGVLGSDNYDKLLILQALRPLLPNALFFTTDLEAQMLHQTVLPYTRNLLIASSFGLQLKDELQRDIPPFRSSYQTAAFFATQAALERAYGAPCTWKEPALLFEVGRTKLFQLPPAKVDPAVGQTKPGSGSDESLCESVEKGIHPAASAMFPQLDRGHPLAAAVAIVALGLGVALSCGFLRRKTVSFLDTLLDLRGRRLGLVGPAAALVVGLGSVVILLAWAISIIWQPTAEWLTDRGQPMMLLEGISVWPTIVLRAAILILCVLLFIHAVRWLDKDFDRVAGDMEIKKCWEEVDTAERMRKDQPWTKFLQYFNYPMRADGGADYKQRFWGPYIYQGFWTARISRTLVGVVAFFILWAVLELVFGNPPAPTRGLKSFWLYTGVSGLLNFTALFLTLFVADATVLCWRVIKALLVETDKKPIVWPQETLKKFGGRVGLPEVDLEHWIDLVFISKRTKCIATLIYFPFIIVALVIISRSGLFANYAPSLPEMLIMALGLLVVAGSAFALRQAAEASRAKAHRRLNDQIMLAKQSEGGEKRVAQLELLSHRVEELNEGALTPFSQQPLLRAMLLPLGSFGGTALLEYLLLPGLS
jgi:hypothetical protein